MSIQDTHFFRVSNHMLNQLVHEKLNRRMDEIQCHLESILTDNEKESIDLKGLIDKYRYPVQLNLRPQPVKKSRTKRDIPVDRKCFGRIGNNSRCSRRSMEGCDLCRIHNNSLPYGRIDSGLDIKIIKMGKKRGRRGKYSKEYTLDDLDHDKYVQAIVVEIDGEPFLMDEHDVLYLFNSNNEIVGRQVNGEVFWE